MVIAYDAGPKDVPLIRQTIGENLAATVARNPTNDALVVPYQGVRLSYSEFAREVDRVARGLLALGLERGDRIGIWSPNNAEWVLIQYATARIGAILVNINPAYRTSELEYALNQSGCRFLVSAPEFLTSDYRKMVAEVAPSVPSLERIIFLGSEAWEELLSAGEKVTVARLEEAASALKPDDPINIQYTSGTTGFPKGATLSHVDIINNGFFTGEMCRYTSDDRVCIPVPFYHCFGMVLGNLACTTHGATIVVPGARFVAGEVLKTVSEERCTSLCAACAVCIWHVRNARYVRHVRYAWNGRYAWYAWYAWHARYVWHVRYAWNGHGRHAWHVRNVWNARHVWHVRYARNGHGRHVWYGRPLDLAA